MTPRRHSNKTANPTQNEAPAMTTNSPDLSTFAASVEDSDESITRTSTRNKYANNPFTPHVLRSRETGKVMAITVPGHTVKEVINHLRAAAKEAQHGMRLEPSSMKGVPEDETPVKVKFQAVEKKATGNGNAECPKCGKQVGVTAAGKIRSHGPRAARCSESGTETASV